MWQLIQTSVTGFLCHVLQQIFLWWCRTTGTINSVLSALHGTKENEMLFSGQLFTQGATEDMLRDKLSVSEQILKSFLVNR